MNYASPTVHKAAFHSRPLKRRQRAPAPSSHGGGGVNPLRSTRRANLLGSMSRATKAGWSRQDHRRPNVFSRVPGALAPSPRTSRAAWPTRQWRGQSGRNTGMRSAAPGPTFAQEPGRSEEDRSPACCRPGMTTTPQVRATTSIVPPRRERPPQSAELREPGYGEKARPRSPRADASTPAPLARQEHDLVAPP